MSAAAMLLDAKLAKLAGYLALTHGLTRAQAEGLPATLDAFLAEARGSYIDGPSWTAVRMANAVMMDKALASHVVAVLRGQAAAPQAVGA